MERIIERKSNNGYPINSMCVQPCFLIGTYNEDGQPDFAPITWLSKTCEGENDLLIISMYGTKKTKMNVLRTGKLSANLVSVDMLPLVDYFGSVSGHDGPKNAIHFSYSNGKQLNVPTLDCSRYVYELEVAQTVKTGESDTFFCHIKNEQIDTSLGDISDGINLLLLDPVIYSDHYHSIGKHLGKIGDYLPASK